MFFDTHAHYDDERYDADRDELLNSMAEGGVSLIVNAGTSVAESRLGLAIAEKFPFVYFSVGVHPHEAKGMDDNSIAELRELAAHPKAVAIGEIGLDYHYNFSPPDVQRARFREQMELVRELGMPVIIHEREAFADVMAVLEDYPDVRGVFHCFSGDLAAAEKLIAMGWMLSFTGAITFKNGKDSLAVAASIPLNRLMLETDSPYLSPVPIRGKRNDSRNLALVAPVLAEARGITVEELAAQTLENGKRFFGIKM